MAGVSRVLALTPTWRPAGGVVKILDYVVHARSAGLPVRLWSPTEPEPDEPIFRIERFAGVLDDAGTKVIQGRRLGVAPDEVAFISWPADVERVLPRLATGASTERIVHIIQNVRHANPHWQGGQPLRLLTRQLSRIFTNDVVRDACAPFVPADSPQAVIPLGHELGYFERLEPRQGLSSPVRVGYTTWKSDVGDRVAGALAGDSRFVFRAIRESVGWDVLRDLYHWCDVFLGCPNPQEGFYMPGLEAMEAGAILVVPDAGGNLAYCRFGVNCLEAIHEDEGSYIDALERVVELDESARDDLRASGRAAIAMFDLAEERRAFVDFLRGLSDHLETKE